MSEAVNPFEPPKAESDRPRAWDEEGIDYFVSASQGARFTNYFVDTIIQVIIMVVLGSDLWLAVFFGYYLFFETAFGKTPGKWLTKTRVISKTGRRPRFMQILGRTLTRLVPFEPFSFFGRKGRGWHDGWSGTRVVRDPGERDEKRRRRRRR